MRVLNRIEFYSGHRSRLINAEKRLFPFLSLSLSKPESSKNGSPVEGLAVPGGGIGVPRLVATVTKPTLQSKAGPLLLSTLAATSLEIDVGNGKLISLRDPDTGAIAKLPPDQVDSTLMQLQLLKEQVDSAMQQLTQN